MDVGSIGIFAAPRTGPDLARAGKAADECMAKLEDGETTEACFETIQQELKNAPRKTKEAVVTIIYFRLRQKYSYIGELEYLNDVRDDLLKRITAGSAGKKIDGPGARLVRYADIWRSAYQCVVESPLADQNFEHCMRLLRSKPLDLSIAAQLHVIRQVEEFVKRILPPVLWNARLYPFLSKMVNNLIGDSI